MAEVAPTILIVDDTPSNLTALEVTLRPLGYPIATAASGPEALKRLAEHDVVLIVMDVHMHGMDGYQTTALIRQREQSRDIPVIFLTAIFNQPEHTHRGYALGAVDYMSKPFDPEVLRGKVRALVLLYTRGLRAERERVQEAEKTKNLFLGAIGHDLRNPLNATILGARMILSDDPCNNHSHRVHAEKIERAGRRMQKMIEDILDLTRNQLAGGIPLSLRPTSLADLCRAVVDECRLARPESELALELTGNPTGLWDADRLARVVSNLVGNAIEHSPAGRVTLRAIDNGETAALEVHNGGTPIDPAVLPTVFEPFRRGDGGASGLGLGLYIVREIVRAHRGSVQISSTLLKGTTFSVTLPKR